MKRAALLISVVALLSLGLAGPVLAATPGNDSYANRQAIVSVPFTDSVDTTEATTAPPDAEAVGLCAAAPTDASVWYEYTPASDGAIIIDASGSDYTAGIAVVSGSPGSFVFENCGTTVFLSVTAGVSYEIVVFDFDGVGNGGTLELTVSDVPPPPTVALTVEPSGSFNARTGVATIRGTVTCSGGNEFGKNNILVQLSQSVGRLKVGGEEDSVFVCDDSTHPWALNVAASNGKFAGGKAAVGAYANACGDFSCGFAGVEKTVTLKK